MNNDIFQQAKINGQWEAETISENDLFKLSGQTEIPPTPQPQATQSSAPNFTDQAPTSTTMPPAQGGFNLGSFFSPELAVALVDSVATTGGVAALSMMGYKAKKSDLSATAKEQAALEPVLKAAMDAANIVITNPFEAAFWGIVVIYGSKVGAVALTSEKAPKKDPKDLNTFVADTGTKKRGRPTGWRKNE